MRVISGVAKGRPLFLPAKSKARPTSDRIKEALFNIMEPVTGKSFLDVFAGSGSVGIEALSRGAALSVFIEKEPTHCEYILRNVKRCGFTENYDICNAELTKALSLLEKASKRFDIIFADPPYEAGLVDKTLECVADGKLSQSDGMIILQHSKREVPDWKQGRGIIVVDQRTYGDTLLTFLQSQKVA
jgi:16S rRNA (guanine966-N2)-methyltransferase